MQFFIAVLMTIFSVCSNLLGSENTLRTELSKEESYDLINFYELNPWEKIEEYQHEKNISFDARLNTDSFCRPLDIALHEDKFDIVIQKVV